jgi:osmoprotectant transport system ATP-binding protein
MTEGGAMIRLEALTKRYPGQAEPAVDNFNLAIPEGEIVVFVGPSGCGKTTTLKMINRIIEPTSGRIFLEGEDVTKANADQLRRRIGYVIQQIGLFPHMTIAANIGLVPRLLGWDKRRVAERVDELLELVGMEPADYRSRYPKELSGGQRQRVGVARAMGADPPVMLMDEPFGAIDPITRERLQNEFLRLQAEIQKTIVFVTHDIDEAIKMGDRIAILQQGSRIAQYDTPENILVNPADAFVEDFIGSGASLKRLQLSRVADVELAQWPVALASGDGQQPLQSWRHEAAGNGRFVLLLDDERRPVGWSEVAEPGPAGGLRAGGEPGGDLGPPTTVRPENTLRDALNEMLVSPSGCTVVVDDSGAYQGVVDLPTIMTAIPAMRTTDEGHT